MATQSEIRQQITDQIVEALGRGVAPWRRPWSTDQCFGAPTNVVSKQHYSGVNPLILEIAAERHKFTSKFWGTFHQWCDLGFQVMKRPDHLAKGSWGTNIVFCKPCNKSSPDAEEEIDEDKKLGRSFHLLRSFTVFNADQVIGDGIDRFRVGSMPAAASEIEERFERAEQVVEATGADIRFGGDQAYYHLADDYIQMPPKSQFAIPDFWDALLHELSHWSEPRLNWDRKLQQNSYGLGELIAELSACYLSSELGLPINETLDNHAAYLKTWLDNMKADSRFLFRATAQASKAADFILSFSRFAEAEELLV